MMKKRFRAAIKYFLDMYDYDSYTLRTKVVSCSGGHC